MGKAIGGALVVLAFVFASRVVPAHAFICEERFKDAEERIQEAEATLKPGTPGLIKQRLSEAKGILESLEAARHRRLAKCPPGDLGGNAGWVEAVAAEVIFGTAAELR